MKNIGEDVEVNIENLKCCGNCGHSYTAGEMVCCNVQYRNHNPVDMANRCVEDWEFDNKNYLDRIVKD